MCSFPWYDIPVIVATHPRRTSRSGNVQTRQRSNVLTNFIPKSFPLNLFADPHPLNPIASILYKNMGWRGPSTLQSPSSISYPPTRHPSNFIRTPSSRNLSSQCSLTPLQSISVSPRIAAKSFTMRSSAIFCLNSFRMRSSIKKWGGGVVMVNQESDKDSCPERPSGATDQLPLFTPMRRTNLWKQISSLTVLPVEWGWRYGWKLPTGSSGRVADAQEKPRVYVRGGAVAGAGHWGEHRHLHHYQRRLPAPAAGRGALAPGGGVYPRHPDVQCEHQLPAHRDIAPQLRGLPRPKYRFHRPGDGHLPHPAELGRPSRAATIERLAGERQLLRRAGCEALSRPDLYRRWRQEARRQPGSGIELQPVGAPIWFGRQVYRPDHLPEWHTLHGRGRRAAGFQGNRVARASGRAVDSHQHARLCAYRPAQDPRESPPLPLALHCRPVETAGRPCGGAGSDENGRRQPGEGVSPRQQGPHRRTLSLERIGAGDQPAAAIFSCRRRVDGRGRLGAADRVRQSGKSAARAGRQARERVEHSRRDGRRAASIGAAAFDREHHAFADGRFGWADGRVLGAQRVVVLPASVSSRWIDRSFVRCSRAGIYRGHLAADWLGLRHHPGHQGFRDRHQRDFENRRARRSAGLDAQPSARLAGGSGNCLGAGGACLLGAVSSQHAERPAIQSRIRVAESVSNVFRPGRAAL